MTNSQLARLREATRTLARALAYVDAAATRLWSRRVSRNRPEAWAAWQCEIDAYTNAGNLIYATLRTVTKETQQHD